MSPDDEVGVANMDGTLLLELLVGVLVEAALILGFELVGVVA